MERPIENLQYITEKLLSIQVTRRQMGVGAVGIIAAGTTLLEGCAPPKPGPKLRIEQLSQPEADYLRQHQEYVARAVGEFINPEIISRYGPFTAISEPQQFTLSKEGSMTISILQSLGKFEGLPAKLGFTSTFQGDDLRRLRIMDMSTEFFSIAGEVAELKPFIEELTLITTNSNPNYENISYLLGRILTAIIKPPKDAEWTSRIEKEVTEDKRARNVVVVRGDGRSRSGERVILTIRSIGEIHVILG